MTTERSDKVFDNWRQAAEKFDYFILGVTGALCAYISQVYKPVKIGINPGSLELAALILLVISAIAGFRRIESAIEVTLLNHRLLRANEEKGALATKLGNKLLINESTGEVLTPQIIQQNIESLNSFIPEIRKQISRASNAASRSYHQRNWLILIGFAALVTSKIWSAYV